MTRQTKDVVVFLAGATVGAVALYFLGMLRIVAEKGDEVSAHKGFRKVNTCTCRVVNPIVSDERQSRQLSIIRS